VIVAGEICSGIESAFVRSAQIDAANVKVEADDGGHVSLAGSVRSWGEEAEAAA
jgi:osmotically-inducible protein OsmY